MKFDQNTIENLGYYVYALIDPSTSTLFYVGKGKDNRVFQHVECALEEVTVNDKYDRIREITSSGHHVQHVIMRHGLTEKVALEIESTLIDYSRYFDHDLTNIVLGHNSIDNGLMTTDAIIRKYNAPELTKLLHPVILININKTYKRGSGIDGIYLATKESWVIAKDKMPTLKYALSEYKGLIVEVFAIDDWYPVETTDKNGKSKTRWGFNGNVAEQAVRSLYVNTSVAHVKRQGASNPIRYVL